ncbi:hypothetical protein Prudu_013851 [Prunus dulcis]|uniref:Uncharacterized protein n=1 Tax=Prunus dulcis TaxID=3755 RepID=A0A4Y1RGA5_PRUDU|nr:hypothetical protein Prudu_013851 [Prunus dulcis]
MTGAIEVTGSTTGPVAASAPLSKVENFRFDQITGETLPNFRQKSKENFNSNYGRKDKMVNCVRQLPDVGHVQGLVRIPKWN